MKKDYNKKKYIMIASLSVLACCLVGGLVWYLGTIKKEALPVIQEEKKSEVTVTIPEILVNLDEQQSETKTSSQTENTEEKGQKEPQKNEQETTEVRIQEEKQSKPSHDKPKSPSEVTPPSESPVNTESIVSIENPDENGLCQPEHMPQQKAEELQGGETQPDGAVYVPGFGWIEDSKEENSTTVAPHAGTGDMIGGM